MWVDIATKEVAEDIDYAELEKCFSAETQEVKKSKIGMYLLGESRDLDHSWVLYANLRS